MTNKFDQTGTYNVDHTAFGGKIYKRDFDQYRSMSDIAARIISDRKFDEQCRKRR